ncbi:MAG: tRNA (adenosine(37)-N6)-threonylcarbamoyltransferase complex transferase subunit TsaD [Clostridia bacterium]
MENKEKKDILILGIESSCDETSIAIVKNGREILANVISSQIDIHKIYGGVVPEIASRNHVKNIDVVLNEALSKAHVTLEDITAISVTYGAGLSGALIVGVSYAKALAYSQKKPLIAVNHIEGHISANYIAHKDLEPPFVCLIVSGGHTALVKVESYIKRRLIGTTTDDAIGEAFDKVARELGLPYPGGPSVQAQAEKGQATIKFVNKPHEKMKDFNFSYSGLKTAVINYLNTHRQKGEEINVPDICASFQEEAILQVINKAIIACRNDKCKKLVLAGGVSANKKLREICDIEGEKNGIEIFYPPLILCTDNAAMIASQGYYLYINGKGIAGTDLMPCPSLPL